MKLRWTITLELPGALTITRATGELEGAAHTRITLGLDTAYEEGSIAFCTSNVVVTSDPNANPEGNNFFLILQRAY